MADDWTALSDLEVDQWPEFLKVEQGYCDIVISILRNLGLSQIDLIEFDLLADPKDKSINKLERESATSVANYSRGQTVSIDEIPPLLSAALREVCWFRLKQGGTEVHIGHDLYVYVASDVLLEWTPKEGIFVEVMRSPYRETFGMV